MAVVTSKPVVVPSELQDAPKRMKQLEATLSRTTLEHEILKDAVDFAKGAIRLHARQH